MGRYLRGTAEERFWHKVQKTPLCWNWFGCRSSDAKGNLTYGSLWVDGHMIRAHRFSYELLVGSIPDGMQIDHLCRNKACVNPAHLELVTQTENMLRGPQIQKAREWAARITHCPRGHEYDEANTIYDAGKRKCRICRNAHFRAYRARKKAEREMSEM